MIFSQKSHEGYLMVDHRASPGLPEEIARRMGYDPAFVREGKLFEAATLGCAHCKTHVIKNPLRTRERGFCGKCNEYVCDGCAAAMREPDYVHRPFVEIADLVTSGRFEVIGGTSSRPLMRRASRG